MTTPHSGRLPGEKITPVDHARIAEAAMVHQMAAILGARQWIVACAYVLDNRANLAAANTYDSPAEALRAYSELAARLAAHETAVLIPVGPVTESEMVAAGLFDAIDR